MKLIKDASEIQLPEKFACPICVGGKIEITSIDEYEQNDDGTWQVSDCGLYIDCSRAPEFPDDDWLSSHWSTPYIDWLPVTERVLSWINRHYRFEVESE
jgi:transcription elongation factor Elf1